MIINFVTVEWRNEFIVIYTGLVQQKVQACVVTNIILLKSVAQFWKLGQHLSKKSIAWSNDRLWAVVFPQIYESVGVDFKTCTCQK